MKRIPSRRWLPLLVSLLPLAGGCLYPLLLQPADTPLEDRPYRVLGPTAGRACQQSVLLVPFAGDASLQTALRRARERVGADALIDIVVDSERLYTFFYNRLCTVVHARGIRFTDGGAAEEPESAPVKSAPAPAAVPPAPAAVPAVAPEAPAAKQPATPPTTSPRAGKQAAAAKQSPTRKTAPSTAKKAPAAQAPARPAAPPAGKKKQAAAGKPATQPASAKPADDRPPPPQFAPYCRHRPGQRLQVETKAALVTGIFRGCRHQGVLLGLDDGKEQLLPFTTIWSVRRLEKEKSPAPAPAPPAAGRQSPASKRAPARPQGS